VEGAGKGGIRGGRMKREGGERREIVNNLSEGVSNTKGLLRCCCEGQGGHTGPRVKKKEGETKRS